MHSKLLTLVTFHPKFDIPESYWRMMIRRILLLVFFLGDINVIIQESNEANKCEMFV